eukprot:g46390.t1
MGPSYACLFVGYVEQSLFRSYIGTIPHLFLCYIDECIGTALCSHEEFEQFINFTKTDRALRDSLIRSTLPTNLTTPAPFPATAGSDMSILGLLQCYNDIICKLKEQHLIFRLGSLQPDGLNMEFTSFKISPHPASSHPIVILQLHTVLSLTGKAHLIYSSFLRSVPLSM